MSGALQAVFQNQRSFVIPVPTIGSALGGGYFEGQISTAGNGIANYNLVVGPASSTQTSLQCKTTNTTTAGTASAIDGPGNSTIMNDASHPAAQFCKAVTVGGFSDWYMPARNELEICYYNLKPTTQPNTTDWATNANAVPARTSNYTSGNPAQTSAADFKDTGAEDFVTTFYWSSTQFNASSIYQRCQSFYYGYVGYSNKTLSYGVRAVRRVAV